MTGEKPFYLRARVWILLVWLSLAVLFYLLFFKEVTALIVPILQVFSEMFADNSSMSLMIDKLITYFPSTSNAEIVYSASVIVANAISYVFFGMFAIYFVAQFVLPIHSGENRWKMFSHFWGNILRLHSSVILIREGKSISDSAKLKSIRPAVVLVDLSSAIVIERQVKRYFTVIKNWIEVIEGRKKKSGNLLIGPLMIFLMSNIQKRTSRNRAAGPGLHFLERGERIISILDLRRQKRTGIVKAYTRDGIKISTNVTTLFSISDESEFIHVAYLNGSGKENLVGLKLLKDKQPEVTIVGDYYALNLQDAAEIHNYVEYGRVIAESSTLLPADFNVHSKSPYSFYPERVFSAAHSEALTQSSKLTPWHELPLRIAIEHFRKHIEQVSFDDLHLPNDPDRFPLLDFKEEFNRKVRYEGVFAYKLVRPLAGIPGESKKWNAYPFDIYTIKRAWRNAELEISPSRNLTSSKILRDRGVKVISAGFSELHIVDDVIRTQMVENWKARWDREIDITRARHELEAMRERTRARVQTQREMTYVLSELFKNKAHSKEALAIGVFQALESAATTSEPSKKIPPAEILSMLNNLHEWLLPEKKNATGDDGDESVSPPRLTNVT